MRISDWSSDVCSSDLIGNANGATGIFAEAGVTGSITNSATGKIVIDESYEGEDIDKDGDKDGPYAVGNGRAGIKTGGAFTGNIVNAGPITGEGNDSAGQIGRASWRERVCQDV